MKKFFCKGSLGKQISVFLANRPGALSEIAGLLGKAGVNIHAMTLTEGLEHGYARLVVDQHAVAMQTLTKAGHLVFDRDVVLLEIANQPGVIGEVSRWLGEGKINIEYAYCAGGPQLEQGLVILKVDKPREALAIICKKH